MAGSGVDLLLLLLALGAGVFGLWLLVEIIQFIVRGSKFFKLSIERMEKETKETFNKKEVLGGSKKKTDLADKYIKD